MHFNLSNITVIQIGPAVVGLHDEIRVVKHRKAVDHVSADGGVDVARLVLAALGPVPSPVGKICDIFQMLLKFCVIRFINS